MNYPTRTNCYSPQKAFEFYFNIEDGERPLFTPLSFYRDDIEPYLTYDDNWRSRGHKNYPALLRELQYNRNISMTKYKIKDKNFMAAQGIICRYELTEEKIHNIFPIAIFCFNEFTDWNTDENFTIIVDNNEMNHEHNKVLRPKLLKIFQNYAKNDKTDIIYTNELKKWCFNQRPNLHFKSIKEQKEYLSQLAEQA